MHSEWYYISQWRENARKSWAVLNKKSKSIIKVNLTRSQAEEHAYHLNQKDNNNFVVNIADELYNEYRSNLEVRVENKSN